MPKDKTFSHQKINKAIYEEFIEKGYEAASVRSIANRAGMTAAGLYRHYPDKEAMFVAFVKPLVNEIDEWQCAHKKNHYDLLKAGVKDRKQLMEDSNVVIGVIGVLLFFFLQSIKTKMGKSVSSEKVESDREMISQIMEYLKGVAEVKSFNLYGETSEKLNEAISKSAKCNARSEMVFMPIITLQNIVLRLIGAAMVFASAFFYVCGTMDSVNAIGMSICSFMIFGLLENVGVFSSLLRILDICVEKGNEILNIPGMNISGKDVTPANYDIELENVDFSYGKRKIIDKISLSIPEKTTTAIVGPSGGGTLSGGEKQRISIARAIMKDSPIIILDEATANVDPENEKDLVSAIDELTKEKTIIMIAHRLKTVRNADQIIVIDKGKVAEQGNHSSLMEINGIYKRFIDAREYAVGWKL